jgi:hypothetical protein
LIPKPPLVFFIAVIVSLFCELDLRVHSKATFLSFFIDGKLGYDTALDFSHVYDIRFFLRLLRSLIGKLVEEV